MKYYNVLYFNLSKESLALLPSVYLKIWISETLKKHQIQLPQFTNESKVQESQETWPSRDGVHAETRADIKLSEGFSIS